MSIAGARLGRRDVDVACNMSKGRGREARRYRSAGHWRFLIVQLEWLCMGLSDLSAGEGGLEHEGKLLTLENKLQPCAGGLEGPELRRGAGMLLEVPSIFSF